MKIIERYFPHLTPLQKGQFAALKPLYNEWNNRVNVISRRDIDHLYERHILHALGIAKLQTFVEGSRILDVGTGGGFPGIPLAILFPESHFVLVDAIGKKINVVKNITKEIGLKNTTAMQIRAEKTKGQFDFVVSRAVTRMNLFVPWVQSKICKIHQHPLKNGILYLKGGDLKDELKTFPEAKCFDLSSFFKEFFFETKKIVHLPI